MFSSRPSFFLVVVGALGCWCCCQVYMTRELKEERRDAVRCAAYTVDGCLRVEEGGLSFRSGAGVVGGWDFLNILFLFLRGGGRGWEGPGVRITICVTQITHRKRCYFNVFPESLLGNRLLLRHRLQNKSPKTETIP